MKRLITILTILLSAISCTGRNEAEFITESIIRLEVNGKTCFTYKPATCQLSYNPENHCFRAMTDNASDFFEIKLSRLPSKEGDSVRGNVRWTTQDSTEEEKNIAFKALKLEGDMIWIHSQTEDISACLRILE